MLARIDKRSDERIASKVRINFSFFSTRLWHECQSWTLNHSEGGLCFESIHPLMPGTNLFIRVDKHPKLNSGIRLRNSTLAEVKWCRELADEHRTGYCVGARYY